MVVKGLQFGLFVAHEFPNIAFERSSQATPVDIDIMMGTGFYPAKRGSDDITSRFYLVEFVHDYSRVSGNLKPCQQPQCIF